MTPDQAFFEFVKLNHENVYFNKFPQSVNLKQPTPKILVTNVSETKTDDKDKKGRYEVVYRVEVIGSNYMNCKATAYTIRQDLINSADDNIYLIVFDNETYQANDEYEVFTIITDYITHINYDAEV
jgi:hypothetical protein